MIARHLPVSASRDRRIAVAQDPCQSLETVSLKPAPEQHSNSCTMCLYLTLAISHVLRHVVLPQNVHRFRNQPSKSTPPSPALFRESQKGRKIGTVYFNRPGFSFLERLSFPTSLEIPGNLQKKIAMLVLEPLSQALNAPTLYGQLSAEGLPVLRDLHAHLPDHVRDHVPPRNTGSEGLSALFDSGPCYSTP